MGYYTDHILSSDTGVELTDEFFEVFKNITSYEPDNLCDIKWYDSEENMKEISLLYPDTLFKLYGDGEDSEDFWIQYYKNGKMQHIDGEITFEDFNPDKLK